MEVWAIFPVRGFGYASVCSRRGRWVYWAWASCGSSYLGCGAAEPVAKKPKSDGFASDRAPAAAPVAFDGARAMDYLKAVCKIGPRISGTDGMKQQQELLQKHFEALGAKVSYQRFTARQHSENKDVAMANLIVSWHPERTRRVILCSHYDTRPIADQEPNRRRWNDAFVSANDGGSGVALLMEMGNHMKELDPAVGVDFVFFDGEEYVFDPHSDEYFFGSKEFAKQYRKNKERPQLPRRRSARHGRAARTRGFPSRRNRTGRRPSWCAGNLEDSPTSSAARRSVPMSSASSPSRTITLPLNQAGIPATSISSTSAIRIGTD